jgi:hypothetical protein
LGQVFFEIAQESDPEGARLPPLPVSTFKTHYAWEGLIVSKCALRVVKQLAGVGSPSIPIIVRRLL